jgi:hypothetical protein
MLYTWAPFGDNAYNINDPVRSHADCVAIHALAHCIAPLRRSLHTIQHDGSSTAFNQEDLFNEMLGIEVTAAHFRTTLALNIPHDIRLLR